MAYKNTQIGSVRVAIVIFVVIIIVGVLYYGAIVSRPKEVANEPMAGEPATMSPIQDSVSSAPAPIKQEAKIVAGDTRVAENSHPKVFVEVIKHEKNERGCFNATVKVFFMSAEKRQNVYNKEDESCSRAKAEFLPEDGSWWDVEDGRVAEAVTFTMKYATSGSKFLGVYMDNSGYIDNRGGGFEEETFIPFNNPKTQYTLFNSLEVENNSTFRNAKGVYEFTTESIQDKNCDLSKPLHGYEGSITAKNYSILINKKPVWSTQNMRLGCKIVDRACSGVHQDFGATGCHSVPPYTVFENLPFGAIYNWSKEVPFVEMGIGDPDYMDDYVFTFSIDDPVSTFKQVLK